jgi:hypothetical protein
MRLAEKLDWKSVRVARHYKKDQIEKYAMGQTCSLNQMHTILR